MTSTEALLTERGTTHGRFEDNARVGQELRCIYRAQAGWNQLTDVQREALDMIACKISRILCGRGDFPDHFVDIGGYAGLALEGLAPYDDTTVVINLGKSAVRYNPSAGSFTWEVCYRKPWRNGHAAGKAMNNGYIYIKANGKKNSCSRIAWTTIMGEIPNGMEIDHINRDRSDNRIENLRLATRAQNLANRENFKPNTVGITGVSLHNKSGLFRARYGNTTTYHPTREEAAESYDKMRLSAVAPKMPQPVGVERAVSNSPPHSCPDLDQDYTLEDLHTPRSRVRVGWATPELGADPGT